VGKKKITVDTNVLISAFGWRGPPHTILEKIASGELELFTSYEQFEELSKVLDYPKFEFTEDQKRRFKEFISEKATFVKSPIKLDIIKKDPSDNKILECALVAGADYIISGDDHLLSVQKFGRIRIMKASAFLRI
jgi:putative PIN family toxin of toxin-antitoxin system